MRRILQIFRSPAVGTVAALCAVLLLAGSENAAAAQRGNRGGSGGGGTRSGGGTSGGGQAVPRSTPRSDPPTTSGPAPTSGTTKAEPRSTPETTTTTSTGETGTTTTRDGGTATERVAVPRGSARQPPVGRTTVIVPGGYYGGFWPWGFGGIGFGSYYGAFYDPWYGGYAYGAAPESLVDGALRLKIKPRDAQVYVDGFYAGVVDDFDGVFQRLRITAGPHHIEVRATGYETLAFDVQIRPDETTKYEGELQKIP